MHHTDDTSIDNVTTEADENDFSDLSDEALDRPPESAAGAAFTANICACQGGCGACR